MPKWWPYIFTIGLLFMLVILHFYASVRLEHHWSVFPSLRNTWRDCPVVASVWWSIISLREGRWVYVLLCLVSAALVWQWARMLKAKV